MASNPNKVMLGLRLPTDPRWVNIVEKDIEEILTDHAYCEQKAASNAISCIVKYPEYSDVVDEMVRICNEEMTHFGMVHDELKKRGLQLGRERKDPYVHDLMEFIMKGGSREAQFVDRMLFAAMIDFARKYAGTMDVDMRWKEFLEYEATLMGKYGKGQTMHG